MRLIDFKPQKVIAVGNRKGGVGKTTITVNIAAELALRGYDVGIVDTDPQGHDAVALDTAPRDENGIAMKEDCLYNALVELMDKQRQAEADNADMDITWLQKYIRQVPLDSYLAPLIDSNGNETFVGADEQLPIGNLYILPGGNKTANAVDMVDNIYTFTDLYTYFMQLYNLDFVFIDTAPTIALYDVSIFLGADALINVTECETLSLEGIQETMYQMRSVNNMRKRAQMPSSIVLGVVPNKKRVLREHNEGLKLLGQHFPGKVWDPMRLLKGYASAAARGQTIRAFDPNGNEANEILQLVNHVEGALAQWLATATI